MEYKNKTVYTDDIYRAIGSQKSFSYEILVMKGMILSVVLWTGARLVQQDNRSIANWLFCAFAIIVLPGILFVYPAIRNRSLYKRSLKANNGKEIVTDITLGEHEIVCKNNAGQKAIRKYEDVTKITKTSKLLILLSDKFEPIYMDLNGFKSASVEDVEAFLNRKCTKLRNK